MLVNFLDDAYTKPFALRMNFYEKNLDLNLRNVFHLERSICGKKLID